MTVSREMHMAMQVFNVERMLVQQSSMQFAKALGSEFRMALFGRIEDRYIIEMMHDVPDDEPFRISRKLDLLEYAQDQGVNILDFRSHTSMNIAESLHSLYSNARVFEGNTIEARLQEVGNGYLQAGISHILGVECLDRLNKSKVPSPGCKYVLDDLYLHINRLYFLGIEPKSPEVCEVFKNARGHSNRAYSAMICGNLPKAVAFMQGSTGKEPFELDGAQTSLWQRALDLEIMDEYESYFKSLESQSLSHQILTELNL